MAAVSINSSRLGRPHPCLAWPSLRRSLVVPQALGQAPAASEPPQVCRTRAPAPSSAWCGPLGRGCRTRDATAWSFRNRPPHGRSVGQAKATSAGRGRGAIEPRVLGSCTNARARGSSGRHFFPLDLASADSKSHSDACFEPPGWTKVGGRTTARVRVSSVASVSREAVDRGSAMVVEIEYR